MKIRKSALLVIGIIIVSLLFSCSDDGGSTGPDEPEPEWQPKTITVPENMEQSQNPMVQMVVAHINTANTMMNTYSSFFQPPEKAEIISQGSYSKDGPPWSYTWSEGDLTITLNITESEDADYDYEWTVVLDGSDGEYTYDNWTYIYAKTTNDNSSGHVTVYKQVTDEVGAIVTWNTDESGVFTMTIEDFHGTQTKIELTSNPDGSGEVDYYEQIEGSYVIQFRAEWEADGSGQWWTYDENGNVENTGIWPYDLVFVQGGTFDMGDHYDEGGSDELPVHSVSLDNFFIGEREVTHQQVIDVFNWAYSQGYIDCSSSTVTNNQGDTQVLLDLDDEDCAIDWNGSSLEFGGSSYASTADCPCIEITWYGAVAYCNYRSLQEGLQTCYDLSDWSCDWDANGYRLPTEAEWEYAARGGINWSDDYRYSGCHNEADLPDYAWYAANAGGETHPVGTKLPNQLDIYDMSGNVYEWCWDWYDSNYYSGSPSNNPTGPSNGSDRVRRGGSWGSPSASQCRVADRLYRPPNNGNRYIGFRILRINLN